MIKKYDFDRVVLFVSLIWLNSIDFTEKIGEILKIIFGYFMINF